MIYFVRHGQTEANDKCIFAGDIDYPLTEVGLQQAKQTAEKLKDFKFDYIFCSPLVRAKKTMEEIAKFHKNAKIVFDERIKERSCAILQGEPIDERDFQRWQMCNWNNDDFGETLENVNMRVKSFLNEIINKYPNKDILIVSHYGIGRLLKCYFEGFAKDGDFTKIKIRNGEIVTLKK